MKKWVYTLMDIVKGVPAVSPLALASAVLRPRNVPIVLADTWRSYRHRAGRSLPSITPANLLKCEQPVTVRVGEHGVFPHYVGESQVCELVAMHRPARVFEFGTCSGSTTAMIAMNTPDSTQIFTLDLPPDGPIPEHASDMNMIAAARAALGKCFRHTPWFGTRIHQLLGDSESFDFSTYFDGIDFVVVDASHTYHFMFVDSMNAFRMLRVGGVILWHDYDSARSEYGVTRFLDRLRKRHGLPVHRLSSPEGESRYAVLHADTAALDKLKVLARRPETF